MNTKGQVGVGTIILTAIAIIVGLTLLIGTGGIAQQSASMTTLGTISNASITAAQWQTGKTITLVGKAATNVVVLNQSDLGAVNTGNYSVANNVILSDGTLGSVLTVINEGTVWNNSAKNISYTYQPLGYASDAASRSIISIIVIFVCLALLTIALSPILRDNLIGIIGR